MNIDPRLMSGFVATTNVLKKGSLVITRWLGFVAGFGFGHLGNLLDSVAMKRLGVQVVDGGGGLPPRVVCTDSPDDGDYPYFREYSVNHFITDQFVTHDYLRDGRLRYIGSNEEAPEITSHLMASLVEIDGVGSVSMEPYEVTVRIGKAYDWSYVEPRIMQVFRDVFEWSTAPLVIERRIRHAGRAGSPLTD